jgi:NAD(P)-dependent dehydrogenase (short-subunit alcohol dehydrogenase family)
VSEKKVVLVTGATRGLGRAIAQEFFNRGHIVYGGGRSWDKAETKPSFFTLKMDVTDASSVKQSIDKIISEHNRIDILVNNAGISHFGSLEETPLDYARMVFETNYFAIVRLTSAVLPHMRKQGGGTIVNIGSAGGKIGIPFQGHYCASKFAVEGLSETMMHELKPFGIRVILIEPGDIETTIWRDTRTEPNPQSPYYSAMEKFLSKKDNEMSGKASSPEKTASEIVDIVFSGSKKLRHPVAKMAGVLLMLRKILPDEVFLYAVAKNYRQT